jgi:hypothetical protein
VSGRERLLTASQIASSVAEAVPGMDDYVESLVEAVFSLLAQRVSERPSETVAAEAASRSPVLELDQEARQRLSRRLAVLLEADTIRLASKATDLVTSYEHVFATGRLFTDVRPVFRDDDTERPWAAVIVNVLKIDHYDSDGFLRSFHVALDRSDLRALQQVIERGCAKTESMKAFLESADLAHWEGGANGDR